MHIDFLKSQIVNSPIGRSYIDSEGSAISGVRMDPSRAYGQIPILLQKYINNNDSSAWSQITDKIDYIYSNIDYAMAGLDSETGFGIKVQSEISAGKLLLFKPNLVSPQVIDSVTHGEGDGSGLNTEWPFIAALMRWFHDKLQISYELCKRM